MPAFIKVEWVSSSRPDKSGVKKVIDSAGTA